MSTEALSTLDAVDEIDETERKLATKAISGVTAVERIAGTVACLIGHSPCEPIDVEFVYEYGREAATRVGTMVQDRVLIELYEELIAGYQLRPLLGARLDLVLEGISARIAPGCTAEGISELVDLCGHGGTNHPLTFRYPELVSKVIDFAHSHSAAQALAAAVEPGHRNAACIAAPRRAPAECRQALDLLAHLAGHPCSESGRHARDALVRMVGSLELGALAVVRLPLHLLSFEQCMELLQVLEARLDLFEQESILAPSSLLELRHTRVIRAATWQAFDALHI